MEVQQYQLQKQGNLNEIGIVVPLKLSQLYTFHGSGTLTGPPDIPGIDGPWVNIWNINSSGLLLDLKLCQMNNSQFIRIAEDNAVCANYL